MPVAWPWRSFGAPKPSGRIGERACLRRHATVIPLVRRAPEYFDIEVSVNADW